MIELLNWACDSWQHFFVFLFFYAGIYLFFEQLQANICNCYKYKYLKLSEIQKQDKENVN